jgi:hypothetical protein
MYAWKRRELAAKARIELATTRLTGERSTAELLRKKPFACRAPVSSLANRCAMHFVKQNAEEASH